MQGNNLVDLVGIDDLFHAMGSALPSAPQAHDSTPKKPRRLFGIEGKCCIIFAYFRDSQRGGFFCSLL
jgi:hypothetical protein